MGTGSCNMGLKRLLFTATDLHQSKSLHFPAFLYIRLTTQKRQRASVLIWYQRDTAHVHVCHSDTGKVNVMRNKSQDSKI